jgi:hypothetical protein
MNKHHSDVLQTIVLAFSELGTIRKQKNAWSGDSYKIEFAVLKHINGQRLKLEVTIQERGKDKYTQAVDIDLDAELIGTSSSMASDSSMTMIPPLSRTFLPTINQPDFSPIDDVLRRVMRLCGLVGEYATTGKLVQLALQLDGIGIGKIHDNLYLNQVPHNRYVRQYFYDLASTAVLDAVNLHANGHLENNLMKVVATFPELNTAMVSVFLRRPV